MHSHDGLDHSWLEKDSVTGNNYMDGKQDALMLFSPEVTCDITSSLSLLYFECFVFLSPQQCNYRYIG